MREELERLLASGTLPALNPTQEKISRAALELFSQSGYDGTTTQAIAQRAGITEKTLFRQFPSKKLLFAQVVYPAIVALCQPVIFQRLQEVLASQQPTFADMIRAIVSERVNFSVTRPEVLKLLTQEVLLRAEFREPFVKFWRAQLLERALGIFRRAKATGQVRDLPEGAMLRAMISMTVGYGLTRTLLAPDLEWDDAAEVDAIVNIMLRGCAT